MKLFVGLGNPEIKFSNNRHNVGYMAIDAINASLKTKYKRKPALFSQKFLQSIVSDYSPFAVLAKPMKYMNDSGVAVKKLVNCYNLDPENLYIIHDDLDIPIGEYKIQMAKGPKVHNGVSSVEEELGTKGFGRIRIGIENRDIKKRTKGEDYVLSDFTEEEKRIIKWVIQKIIHDELFENLRYA
ncbi:MAG TPA: aminoacyl-tRNA hydrolase [Candidatus Saccharimonadales bacterium]|nr:aminoacyl-tRNA hydrolase [Candidatus Saccharimonadales bacterium]